MMWACPPSPPPPAMPACAGQQAHLFARMLHDRHPRWIRAVETTDDDGRAIVIVEMKGKFVDNFDSRDPLAPQRPYKGRYFVLRLDPSTCLEVGHSIGNKLLRLRPLGQVVKID